MQEHVSLVPRHTVMSACGSGMLLRSAEAPRRPPLSALTSLGARLPASWFKYLCDPSSPLPAAQRALVAARFVVSAATPAAGLAAPAPAGAGSAAGFAPTSAAPAPDGAVGGSTNDAPPALPPAAAAAAGVRRTDAAGPTPVGCGPAAAPGAPARAAEALGAEQAQHGDLLLLDAPEGYQHLWRKARGGR